MFDFDSTFQNNTAFMGGCVPRRGLGWFGFAAAGRRMHICFFFHICIRNIPYRYLLAEKTLTLLALPPPPPPYTGW